jgi:hypothetical protein
MEERRFHFAFPWITLYIALIIVLFTYIYASLPFGMQNGFALWITSPFNIFYEMQSANGLFYNYFLVILIYLLVELYTRNTADLKHRVALIRNAAIFSVFSSYVVSAIIWAGVGFPSSGTSIIAFNVLLFAAFETYDSELIKRMSERRVGIKRTLEISSIVFVVLLVMVSMLLFIYLNGNTFWYVHIAGGMVFAPIYYIYLSYRIRWKVDEFEEKLEKDVEEDLEETGVEIEKEAEKLEEDVKKGVKGKGKKTKRSS